METSPKELKIRVEMEANKKLQECEQYITDGLVTAYHKAVDNADGTKTIRFNFLKSSFNEDVIKQALKHFEEKGWTIEDITLHPMYYDWKFTG